MGTSALSLKLRWRAFWWTIPKRLQILLVLLVVGGVVAATGTILNSTTRTQVVSGIGITTTPTVFPGVFTGDTFGFVVTLTNPSGALVSAHVSIIAVCPVGGVATIAFVGGIGGATGNACSGGIESASGAIAAGGSRDYGVTVVYSGVIGTYTLTIAAHLA